MAMAPATATYFVFMNFDPEYERLRKRRARQDELDKYLNDKHDKLLEGRLEPNSYRKRFSLVIVDGFAVEITEEQAELLRSTKEVRIVEKNQEIELTCDSDGSGGSGDLESGDGKPRDAGAARAPPLRMELGVVVIMAGEEKATHLATPMSSRASSFGDNNKGGRESEEEGGKKPAVEAAGHGSSPATPVPHRQLQEGAHGNGDQESHHSHEDERPTPEEETHHSADRNQ